MNTLKIIALAIIVLFVLLTNGFAQKKDSSNVINRLYFQAGIKFYSLNNSGEFKKLVDNGGLFVSAAYAVNSRLRLNMNYVFFDETSSNESDQTIYFANGGNYQHMIFDKINSNMVSIKAQYFLSSDLYENPVYFTGGFASKIQSVYTVDLVNVNYIVDTTVGFQGYHYETISGMHLRMLLGPELGAGLYFALGRFNFQTELTFSALFSPFRDRNYRELSFNLYNGLVYKF